MIWVENYEYDHIRCRIHIANSNTTLRDDTVSCCWVTRIEHGHFIVIHECFSLLHCDSRKSLTDVVVRRAEEQFEGKELLLLLGRVELLLDVRTCGSYRGWGVCCILHKGTIKVSVYLIHRSFVRGECRSYRHLLPLNFKRVGFVPFIKYSVCTHRYN